jgi:RHS repeat-associated protein
VSANTTLTYDLADRLLTTVLPGPGNTTTSFTLDALGRIATRTPPGGSAEPFAYLGTSETVTSIGGVTPVSAALDPAGSRLASQSGASTGFLLADLHANLAAATTSGETALLSAVRYDPYGGTAASWDSGAAFPMPWRFQGRFDLSGNPTDPLYEWSARYYLPAVGAFSQLDTYPGSVADPRSLHRYLYAAANPWTLIDPTGHAVTCGADGQCAGRQPPPPINPDKPAPKPQPPAVPKPTPAIDMRTGMPVFTNSLSIDQVQLLIAALRPADDKTHYVCDGYWYEDDNLCAPAPQVDIGPEVTLASLELVLALLGAVRGNPGGLPRAEESFVRAATRIQPRQLDLGLLSELGQTTGLVIGRGQTLRAPGVLREGEHALSWLSVSQRLGHAAEWTVNSHYLQRSMAYQLPIRDASPLTDLQGFYLNLERALLRSSGWTPSGGYWYPPGWGK